MTELALDPRGLHLGPCFSSPHDLILGPLETITINKQKPSSHLLIHAGLRECLILGTRQSQPEQKFSQRLLFSPLGLLCLTTVSVTTSALYFYRIFFKACTCSMTECLVFGDERMFYFSDNNTRLLGMWWLNCPDCLIYLSCPRPSSACYHPFSTLLGDEYIWIGFNTFYITYFLIHIIIQQLAMYWASILP